MGYNLSVLSFKADVSRTETQAQQKVFQEENLNVLEKMRGEEKELKQSSVMRLFCLAMAVVSMKQMSFGSLQPGVTQVLRTHTCACRALFLDG